MSEEGYISLFYYKVWQFNFAGFFDVFHITKCGKVILLQSVTNCYYKVCQVLQSVTVITKWDVTPPMYLEAWAGRSHWEDFWKIATRESFRVSRKRFDSAQNPFM